MWLKWLPWEYMVRTVARRRGFIDPMAVLARLNGFAQPAETQAPLELLRAGLVLHARGFLNNQVIDHNLDWVWPLWVSRQFNPRHPAFIPRAFSLTHINLTQRNWTAIGYPGSNETPIVDAHGLLMPFFDSWSLDAWFLSDSGTALLPSRLETISQSLSTAGNLAVQTEAEANGMRLHMRAEVDTDRGKPVCRLSLEAEATKAGWLVAALRPYNPEGISFLSDIALLPEARGWRINHKQEVFFSRPPDGHSLSRYRDGDVYLALQKQFRNSSPSIHCEVGMATGAALYRVEAGACTGVTLEIPLTPGAIAPLVSRSAEDSWRDALEGGATFTRADGRFQFLFDAALRTVLLLSPKEVYAGPYTYKRFWFRDAAIILHAILCLGYRRLGETILDYFVSRQLSNGYFRSQEGEWDSNGQVLWVMGRYCRLFHVAPKPAWIPAIRKAVHWIRGKRTASTGKGITAGLMPAGFSAEHLGPNDFYLWDDFWTLGGLRFAEEMLRPVDAQSADLAAREALALGQAIDQCLAKVADKIGTVAMPASPHRRMDSGAVGSVAACFPLQLFPARDPRLTATLDWLWENCRVRGAFYHDIVHSGINPYLNLHIAQGLLRAEDGRFQGMMDAIAELASPTGQWPEAIHPQLGTGCMGDGQHAWAAAEWLMMVRNCFVFEEDFEDKLILAAGLSAEWCPEEGRVHFGPAPTRFGTVSVQLERRSGKVELSWSGQWHGAAPEMEIRFSIAGLVLSEEKEGRRVYHHQPKAT